MALSASGRFMPTPEAVRRVAALVCLAGAYQCAATGFGLCWLLVTIVATLVIATGRPHWAATPDPPEVIKWPSRGALLFGLLPGWLFGVVAAAYQWARYSPRLVISLWLAGVVWVLIGASVASRGTPSSARQPARWAWGWGVLVVGLGAVLRMWHVGSIPSFVHGDEEMNARFALGFFADANRDWFAPSISLMHLYFALCDLGTLVFGFTVLGARAGNVLLGILALAFLFEGLRHVASRRLAVVGTLLTAVNHTHIAFLRVGTGNIQATCVVAAVFAIFSRMWTAPTYLNATLLGLAVAIGIQTYQASLATPPLLVAVMSVLLLFNPERRRALAVPMCLFVLTVATIGAPVAVAFRQHRTELTPRAQLVSLVYPDNFDRIKRTVYHTDSSVEVITQQAWRALLGFHWGRDYEAQYHVNAPMADAYTAALMSSGVVLALVGFRQFLAANALIFTVGHLLLGLGIVWPPGFNRAAGALGLGPVLAAIALVQCADTLCGTGKLARRLRDLFLGAVVVFLLVLNAEIYLTFERGNTDLNSQVGWLARQYANQYHVHLVSWPLGLPGNDGLRILVSELPIDRHREQDPVAYVERATLTGADLFIIHAAHTAARDATLRRFPHARVEPWPGATSPSLFLVFVDRPP